MEKKEITFAAIGFTGKVTEIFVNGFLSQNIKLRLLARNAQLISERYNNVDIVKGSMMNVADVEKVLKGVDAAILTTPMGVRNNNTIEINAAKAVIEGAKAAKLKHLIYISTLGVDKPQNLSILDAKYEIEKLLKASGLNYTAIRCGSYMEDVFNPRLSAIKKGTFLFPVLRKRVFTYTSQVDIPRFVVEELIQKEQIINGAFNFVAPGTYSIYEIENLLTEARGKAVKATGQFPFYQMLWLLQPYFYLSRHRFSTIVPLLKYFNKFGYVASGDTVQNLFPHFKMTTLDEHFQSFWEKHE